MQSTLVVEKKTPIKLKKQIHKASYQTNLHVPCKASFRAFYTMVIITYKTINLFSAFVKKYLSAANPKSEFLAFLQPGTVSFRVSYTIRTFRTNAITQPKSFYTINSRL